MCSTSLYGSRLCSRLLVGSRSGSGSAHSSGVPFGSELGVLESTSGVAPVFSQGLRVLPDDGRVPGFVSFFFFFFSMHAFIFICGFLEFKTHRMETLLSQKGQLSQVPSMLTHAAPVAILSSGDKIGNWECGKL